ncbi:unnamed protein product [Nippostrongylus brasiliensis]|uniref:IS4 family transposase n=1 Tax=Nippostrongylus brasiliensis TaxID=27835 RepID=A0A0N4YCQ2_NIPBR|nr:unnamed protein product [Nippostrongylus brasiliensis]
MTSPSRLADDVMRLPENQGARGAFKEPILRLLSVGLMLLLDESFERIRRPTSGSVRPNAIEPASLSEHYAGLVLDTAPLAPGQFKY